MFCGPWIKPSASSANPAAALSRHQNILSTLAKQLPKAMLKRAYLDYGNNQVLPLLKQGWRAKQFHSYRLRTDQLDAQTLWDNLAGKVRTDLRKTGPTEAEIHTDANPDLFKHLYDKLARKRKVKPFFHYPRFEALFQAAAKRGQAKCWVYYLRDYIPVAAIWMPFDHKSAYLIAAASDPENRPHYQAMTHLIWHAVQWCVDQKLIFDFEGSSLPGVEEYYRSFGPEVGSYLQVEKSSFKLA